LLKWGNMSSPIFQLPPILELPFVTPPNQASSPFNSQQQNVLTAIANSLTSVSNVGQLTGNIYNAENTLETNGTTLNNLVPLFLSLNKQTAIINNPTGANSSITDLINTESTLSKFGTTLNNFVTSLNSLTGVASNLQSIGADSTLVSNLTTLNSFLSGPSSYIQGLLGNILPNVFSTQTIAGSNVTSQQLIKGLITNPQSLGGPIVNILQATLSFSFSNSKINNSGVWPQKIVYDMISSPNNLTQDMQNIIWNGSYSSWTSFILSLFSTSTITSNYGSTKISPSTFMSDLMSLSSNLRADIGQLVIQGLDDGLYNLPYGPANKIYSGSPGINTWVNDLIGVGVNGGNPVPIISDFLNIGNIGNISGFNLSPGTGSFQFNVNPNFGIGNFLLGILTNISNLQTDLFIGTPIPVSNPHIDNIIFEPINGTTIQGYSTTAVYPFTNLQYMPPLLGRLGYILQAGWTAQSEMMYISSQDLPQLESAINNLNPISALNVLVDIVRRIIAALDYGGRGLQQLSLIAGQITSIVANVGNFHNMPSLLGSSSLIPVSPPDFQSGLGYQMVVFGAQGVQALQSQFS
jgi:hypothetical protein